MTPGYKCAKCKDTGVIETGNNDLPCDCLAGDKALFNVATGRGMITIPGAEVRANHFNKREQ